MKRMKTYGDLKSALARNDGQDGRYHISRAVWEDAVDPEFFGPANTAYYVVYEDSGSYRVAAVLHDHSTWVDVSGPNELKELLVEKVVPKIRVSPKG